MATNGTVEEERDGREVLRERTIGVLAAGVIILGAAGVLIEQGRTQAAPPDVEPRGAAECVTLHVVASSEKAELLEDIAQKYTQTLTGEGCESVEVTGKPSGEGAEALSEGWDEEVHGPRPDVWSPAASTWSAVPAANEVALHSLGSTVSSPLVLAMPTQMVEALGWEGRSVTWDEVLDLTAHPNRWEALGHPEWGAVKLGRTNPHTSTVGMHTSLGVAAGGGDERRKRQEQLERGVAHYGETTLELLEKLYAADREGRQEEYLSGAFVEAKSVHDYNHGDPTGNPDDLAETEVAPTRLAAVPVRGALPSDNPYLLVEPERMPEDVRRLAEGFHRYLLSEPVQQELQEAGFEPPQRTGEPVERERIVEVLSTWDGLRRSTRVLLALDVSGSMADETGSGTRLDLTQEATRNVLGELEEEDEVGMWVFSTEQDGILPHREVVPVGTFKENREKLALALERFRAGGGTGLYAAVRAAHAEMVRGYDPERTNAVVLLTDGRNEFPLDDNLEDLLSELESRRDTPVRVYTIGYGPEVDMEVLRSISAATDGRAYRVADPAAIETVLTDVLSSF